MGPVSDRETLAERMRGYFGVQLMLAERIAALSPSDLGEAALRCTNLHRRFGLGRPEHGAAPAWSDYAGRLEQSGSATERLDWTIEFFVGAPEETAPAGHVHFGCFACEPPDADGAVKIHFNNRDTEGGLGPLASAKAGARMAELDRLTAHVRAAWPHARKIKGGSWLYNLEAYRRLFPPAYAASRRRPEAVRLTGSSSWGQFLDWRGAVKPDLAQAFAANLDRLDPAAPWRAFPLPALTAEAPVDAFIEFYEAQAGL